MKGTTWGIKGANTGVNRVAKCEACGDVLKERIINPYLSTHYGSCMAGRVLKWLDTSTHELSSPLAHAIRDRLDVNTERGRLGQIVRDSISEIAPAWVTVRRIAGMPNLDLPRHS